LLLSAHANVLHNLPYPVTMPEEAAGYARELYRTLHALDELNCEVVFVEAVPAEPQWEGVRDRLRRATHV
jgi:L-threonylcarbamoyladenylate synthase